MQTTDKVFGLLNGIRKLSPELHDYINSNLEFHVYKKKEIYLEIGQICRQMAFVEKGFFRCYNVDDEGKEINSWFMQEGDVMIAVDSYYDQVPSKQGIQATEDSEVWSISHDKLEKYIYEEYPEFNYHGRILTLKYSRHFCKEKDMLQLNKSVEERLRYVVQTFPGLRDRVYNKDLASYARISEGEMSRIRL